MCLLMIRLLAKVDRNTTTPDEKPRKALAVGTGIAWKLAVLIRKEAVLIGLFLVVKVKGAACNRARRVIEGTVTPMGHYVTDIYRNAKDRPNGKGRRVDRWCTLGDQAA